MGFILVLLAALAPWPAAADQAVRVVTDNVEYCQVLAARLAGQGGAHASARHQLAGEGLRLCEAGQVRTGVAKLRRAIRANQIH
ncbi:MAG TPA: hypothetical protein VE033_05005 [Acetobacteraceae bacterium]|jgi:hypothetical protein|nr:hypothetical protein [Acetobacteraceae bacterium]